MRLAQQAQGLARYAAMLGFVLSLAGCGKPAPPAAPAPSEKPAPAPAAKMAHWPTYHGAPSLDGVADVVLPEALGKIWQFDAGARVGNTPVAEDGLIFFANDKGVVFAVDLEGKQIWSKVFTRPVKGDRPPQPLMFDAPLAVFDKTVIAGANDGQIIALNAADGAERWRLDTQRTVLGTPNVAEVQVEGKPQKRLYVIDEGQGALQAIDFVTGKLLWVTDGIDRCDGSPSVSAEHVVFGSCASALHIFSTLENKMLREIPLEQDSQVAGGVVLLGDSMFSGSRSGVFIHANAKTGEKIWSNSDCTGEAMATPAVSADRVVFGANDATLYALNRGDGKLVWKKKLGDTPGSPVIARDKVIVSANGVLMLLRLSDGETIWKYPVSDMITSPAVIGALVVVGSDDGTVTAFGATTN